jgi:sphingomyelin phosphodiesterase
MRSAFIGFSVVGVLAIILMVWYQIASIGFVGSSSLGLGANAAVNSSSQSVDPELTNTIPQASGGPILYYNGSGPVPPYNEMSPVPTPITPLNSTSMIEDYFFNEISGLMNGTSITDNCTQCIFGVELMHLAAITQPVQTVTNLLIRACEAIPAIHDTIYAATCFDEFSGVGGLGPYWAQLFSKMSMATGDMQAFCYFKHHVCERPPTVEIDESLYFTTKPESANIVPEPSGKTINVLHLSDWHLDPRYDIGSEANCSQYLCCRPYTTNTDLCTNAGNASVPASRFGYLYCDSPPDLALSSFASMPSFFEPSNVSFAIFTGDIVSHDRDDQLSRAYIEYEEKVTYQTFKAQMKNTPIYATLGNHDSLPQAYNTQNTLDPVPRNSSTNALSWNYDLLSSMWETDGWITSSEASYASTHYGAYAHTTAQGLRIISLNTDFYYAFNIFNYWNFTNPDTSGILTFLANELSACEKAGQRAWVIGHVHSGYEGINALPNPSALFYSIVRRFSPATLAGVFFGHTHEDQLQIFYDYLPNSATTKNGKTYRNTTMVDYSKPLAMGFIGPSITPFTGRNSGYQLYQVDAKTFSVTGVQTYFANVSEANSWTKPVWQFEYDARAAYAPSYPHGKWPSNAPLNATFWDGITTAMLSNQTLVEMYNLYETKSSVVTQNCSTKACARQKVCYIRSGSSALGHACPHGDGPL